MTGIGEVVLLPLDVLKIKMQTNPDALRGRGFFTLLKDEGVASLYRGWGWTMARNAPGSFALFGGSAATKEYLFKLSDYSQATWGQSKFKRQKTRANLRLCRIYRRCRCFHHCCRSLGCSQDTYPECQLQLASRRNDHHQGDDQAGGSRIILQGINTKGRSHLGAWLISDLGRWPQACILIHSCPVSDPLLWQIR
jgi:hypothetical protein